MLLLLGFGQSLDNRDSDIHLSDDLFVIIESTDCKRERESSMISTPSLSHRDHLTIDILFDEIVLSLLQLFGVDYGVTNVLTIE